VVLAGLIIMVAAIGSFPYVLAGIMRAVASRRLVGGDECDQEFATRVHVVSQFMHGLADGISGRNLGGRGARAGTGSFELPFRNEGICAGLMIAASLARWNARRQLADFLSQWQRHVFLLTLGSGFARGVQTFYRKAVYAMQKPVPAWVPPKLHTLFFDGLAFQRFILNYRRRPSLVYAGLVLQSEQAHGFYQGAGRALWFLLPSSQNFVALLSHLPDQAADDCKTGYGIASGFAGCRGIPQGSLSLYSSVLQESPEFRTGVLIGLFARYYVEPAYLEKLLADCCPDLLAKVRATAGLYEALGAEAANYQEWTCSVKLQLASDGPFDETSSTVELIGPGA
jgi:hypothetical protein